ncbi:site-specific integrase [Mucilaginibacter aquariorum]|uniref:Site-specific integrase n=1 Tax=Mucilaginibacter aquariorum TaxID=2967225 RepID=A0ABT1T3U2_9SPHI|nr:site-specific integrase [Mucilaginibacter aquariorum]MCQ6958613.1 site-specific integrase [Mucilaginibacter aquariorum]
MKTTNTFGVHFLIRQDKLKEGKAPVYARITVNTDRILIGLKQWIDPKSWDIRKGAGKGAKDEVKSLNNYLSEVRTEFGECYRELQLKKKVITAADVKITFLRVEEVEHTLQSLFKFHNEREKHKLNENTLSHYLTTQRYLSEFINARYHKKDLSLKDVNFKFLSDFENFLRDYQPKKNKKPIGNTGAMTHLIRLKKMLNLAISLDWIGKNPFFGYRIKIRHEARQYLNKTELSALEAKTFALPRLDYVRDLFVFCCYTGLAYIDAINLTRSNIVVGIDNGLWIKTKRNKTLIPVNTPLLPKAVAILKKYETDYRAINNGTLFPLLSNQKMNSYLKEIADLCVIDKNLTSHIARHTFATTVTLSNNVPIETVSKMLGHTKIGTTQIYAKVIEQKVSDDMAVLRNKLG